jgi:hypothetical protein
VSTSPEPDAQQPAPDAEELARIATPATVRHAPRYRAFVLTGVVLGAVLAFVVVNLVGTDAAEASDLGSGPVFVFVALTFGVVGALLGALVALLLDRRSRR